MALIRCTKLLLAQLPPHYAGLPAAGATSVLGDWYAHLLLLDRRKWLLFTNEASLFSFTVPYVRKPQLGRFFLLFRDHLRSNLEAAGCSMEMTAHVLADYDQLTVTNTNNRSVIGSMNDIAFRLQCYASGAQELTYQEVIAINLLLNDAPMRGIDYASPVDRLREMLAASAPAAKELDRGG